MEGLRSWAASVIAAAVLAGIVEFVLPKSHLEKSVRALLSLFMLVTFLTPAVGLISVPQQIGNGLDALLEEYEAQKAMEETVKETLEHEIVSSIRAFAESRGAAVSGVRATVAVDEDNIITVRRIEIEMDGTQEEIEALDGYAFENFSVHPIIRTVR